MADISKVTTPITNKNIVVPVKEQRSTDGAAVDFQDLSRVLKMTPESEILQQNTGNIQQQRPPSAMLEQMSNPQATVGYIRSIMMLQEIVGILPLHNQSFTEEIEQLFSQLMLSPDQLTEEMLNQEHASTAFKGEMFDFLRNTLNENPTSEMRAAVLNFLKAINSETNRSDILSALSGSFSYLSGHLAPNQGLSSQLARLSELFAQLAAGKEGTSFSDLQHEANLVLQDVEQSILYSAKTERLVSLARYNLSRYNGNHDFLRDATNELVDLLPNSGKTRLLQSLYDFLAKQGAERQTHSENNQVSDSQVLDALSKILEKQSQNAFVRELRGDAMEGIIHSLLSSPSNYTPLLHFLLPVQDEDTAAMAELWINPDEQREGKDGPESSVHMLVVFDVDGLGRFETELYAKEKELQLSLFCPPECTDLIQKMSADFKNAASVSGYHMKELQIAKLERPRSLVDVFPALPEKRTGLNARI